jgi:hypothetical protein
MIRLPRRIFRIVRHHALFRKDKPRSSEEAKLREVGLIVLRATSLLRCFAVIFMVAPRDGVGVERPQFCYHYVFDKPGGNQI